MSYISKIRLNDDTILLLKDSKVRDLVIVPAKENESPRLKGALIIGNKRYEGFQDVEITAEDLGFANSGLEITDQNGNITIYYSYVGPGGGLEAEDDGSGNLIIRGKGDNQ